MKIIKRSGTEVIFDKEKILAAVCKANESVVDSERRRDSGSGGEPDYESACVYGS